MNILRVATDGACSGNPGVGGWGVVFDYNDNVKSFSGGDIQTTNNRMELQAIISCLEIVVKAKTKINRVELMSDSAYCVNPINKKWLDKWRLNGWKTSQKEPVKNQDLWEEFIILQARLKKKGVDLSVIKVKGHNGHALNERADKVAKQALEDVKKLTLQDLEEYEVSENECG